jgi:hypothetical protein
MTPTTGNSLPSSYNIGSDPHAVNEHSVMNLQVDEGDDGDAGSEDDFEL